MDGPPQTFCTAASMDDEDGDISAYDARAINPSAAIDSRLVASDFDFEFPPLADQSTAAGFLVARAQVQRQNLVTQDVYDDRHVPLSKWLYCAHRDQRLSVRAAQFPTRYSFEQRRLRRGQLRKAAWKAQQRDDMVLMIVEWGGDFNSALSLPPMALPGERYVRLEDVWTSDPCWSEASLAEFRVRTEPERVWGEEIKVGGWRASYANERCFGTNDFFNLDAYYAKEEVACEGGSDMGRKVSCDVTRPTQSVPISQSIPRKRPRSDSQSCYTYSIKFPRAEHVTHATDSSQRHEILLSPGTSSTQQQQQPRTIPPLILPQCSGLLARPSIATGLPPPLAARQGSVVRSLNR